jgi:glycerol-3-phosphate dehydrogenase
VTAAEVDTFIAEANEAFPALRLTRADVTLVHRGIVPAGTGRGGRPDLLATPEIRDHAKDGAAGAFTVIGVKYTTARGVAERAVNVVARSLGTPVSRSRTATTVLPGAGIADHEALAIETARASGIELQPATIAHLIGRYAESAADIVRLIAERADLVGPVTAGTDTLRAEVVHVIRTEMAVRLADIVVRRTGLGAAAHPGEEAVRACAAIAAEELGWDEPRVRDEMAAVDRVYEIE